MKKIVSLMIGLSLIMGTASIVFAQDKDDTKKEEGKKKGKKKEDKKEDKREVK